MYKRIKALQGDKIPCRANLINEVYIIMATSKRADNGNGSIHYEADRKSFKALFTTPAGKRITKRFKSKDEANNWLASLRTDATNGCFVEPNKITLEEWIKTYLETYAKPKVRPKTLIGYGQTAIHLAPIKDIPLQSLTAPIIQQYFNTVEISDSAKKRVFVFLKQVISKAMALDYIKKNFMLAVELPKYKQKEIEIFTADEVKQLLEWTKTSKRHQRYYPILLLAACSGCRLGEVLGLKINNVLDDRIKIDNSLQEVNNRRYDSPPKTDAGYREITLPPIVIAQLRKAFVTPITTNCDYVFHTVNGTSISPSNFETNWKRILELADIPHKHFHALRHTHATELLGKNLPLLEVSKRLGHSKPAHTLNMYGHAIKGFEDKIADEVCRIYLA